MHELSISAALLRQVALVAAEHGASAVSAVTLRLGPLCGVEPALLRTAYLLARGGTVAAQAELFVVEAPIRILCRRCARVGDVARGPLSLACAGCGSDDTTLLGGDEMLLESVELSM